MRSNRSEEIVQVEGSDRRNETEQILLDRGSMPIEEAVASVKEARIESGKRIELLRPACQELKDPSTKKRAKRRKMPQSERP
jgi:hypothetical protein